MRDLSAERLDEIEAGTREYGVLSFDVVLELIANLRAARRERDESNARAGSLRAAWIRRGALLGRVHALGDITIGGRLEREVVAELALPDPSAERVLPAEFERVDEPHGPVSCRRCGADVTKCGECLAASLRRSIEAADARANAAAHREALANARAERYAKALQEIASLHYENNGSAIARTALVQITITADAQIGGDRG